MPPNRQAVTAVIRSLSFEDLEGFVTESKYAPLAEEQGEIELERRRQGSKTKSSSAPAPQHEADTDEEPGRKQAEPVSYWAWPSLAERQDAQLEAAEADEAARQEAEEWEAELVRRNAVVAQILEEQEARKAASTANIEAKLVANASESRRKKEDVVRNANAQEEGGFWDWEAKNDSDEGNDAFSAAHIEELLKKQALRIKIHSHSPQNCGEAKEEYWEWDTLTPEEEKRRLIAKILEDERARELLAVLHVVGNLKNARAPSSNVVRNETDSDEYWSPRAPVTKAPHTSDPAHPNNKYWDWTPPVTAEDARRGVLEKVLADEEARRTLAVTHTEEMLRREAEQHALMEQQRWNDLGMGMGCEGGYWGM